MGHMYSAYVKSPDTAPDYNKPPTFEANYGFENGREVRKNYATKEELQAANIKPHFRDYCAHLLLPFYKCRNDNWPWVVNCKPELHAWEHCQYEDFVLRMKEYERERRLLERAKRKRAREGRSAEENIE
ncbi:DgyrCDS13481 [Dimorphilus gyrociliatus]|uniref:NADH dehydrogenase [ubiquinone] 1 beta subcomplex subunit 7 n=1 Tax=Dimorphilus gyrociliatus TaxID=2664684 RepID=A0A7I8WAS1_9ANNE|nr:DgyrCDS13481 [Dimorphilus gyrociliatus]